MRHHPTDRPGFYPTDRVVALARKYMAEGADARSAAIQAVDEREGYTMEFAPSPAQHRDHYDHIEEELNERTAPRAE